MTELDSFVAGFTSVRYAKKSAARQVIEEQRFAKQSIVHEDDTGAASKKREVFQPEEPPTKKYHGETQMKDVYTMDSNKMIHVEWNEYGQIVRDGG